MFFDYFLIYFNPMKILNVYDKINRNVFHTNESKGSITIKEYGDNDYSFLFINTHVFKLKDEKRSFFSYINYTNLGIPIESIDITVKYLIYCKFNDKGLVVHSERIHLKDNKSFLISDRIYDDSGEFIEVENYKGNKIVIFKIQTDIVNDFLKQK